MAQGASRSREGAWIEIRRYAGALPCRIVAPVRERGLKCPGNLANANTHAVAPVRERGLKSLESITTLDGKSRRSREGAWIEILSKSRGK